MIQYSDEKFLVRAECFFFKVKEGELLKLNMHHGSQHQQMNTPIGVLLVTL